MVKGAHDFTFAELSQKIRESRGGKEIKLALNTTARFLSSTRIAIRLYTTDIIIVGADNTYQLFTNGHDTATTKDRISGFSPVQIKTVKGCMCINSCDGIVPFCDGMKVDRSGCVVSGGNCKPCCGTDGCCTPTKKPSIKKTSTAKVSPAKVSPSKTSSKGRRS